jgi:SAM-dependent methyltransferase
MTRPTSAIEHTSRRARALAAATATVRASYEVLNTFIDTYARNDIGFLNDGVVTDDLGSRSSNTPLPPSAALYELALGDCTGLDTLDVGSGRGGGAAVALGLGARRAVGVELAFAGASAALRENRGLAVNGDAHALGVREASIDVVTCVESSQFYSDLPAVLREIRRILRPNGRFGYADIFLASAFPAYTTTLVAAGFTIKGVNDVTTAAVAAFARRDLTREFHSPARAAIEQQIAGLTQLHRQLRSGRYCYVVIDARPGPPARHASPEVTRAAALVRLLAGASCRSSAARFTPLGTDHIDGR